LFERGEKKFQAAKEKSKLMIERGEKKSEKKIKTTKQIAAKTDIQEEEDNSDTSRQGRSREDARRREK
jgi:hypothetical protein